jgi:MerR family copper efflux transcriptional regulator
VSTYTIGDIARRSGFSTSALRYYEAIGLVSATTRTSAGYRVYDNETLERLAFISRAKQLGCSLEEVADLIVSRDTGRCEPVQRRFHTLVTDKIRDAQHRIGELAALTNQLRAAAAQLGGLPVDGPCGSDCACIAEIPPTLPSPFDPSPDHRLESWPDDRPVACTLEADEIPDRLDQWRAVLDRARSISTTSDGATRVEFPDSTDLDELARLVAAEQRCCAFFAFTITLDAGGIALEVRTPDGAIDIADSLFGRRPT